MPNIAAALKSEIARVARKELKQEFEALRALAAKQRKELSALKADLAAVEKQLRATSRGQTRGAPKASPENSATPGEGAKALRFSAQRFGAQRKKLGLSAADFATVLGVSPLTVYNWESGKSRPRAAQLQAIASARGLGKREAARILETRRASA